MTSRTYSLFSSRHLNLIKIKVLPSIVQVRRLASNSKLSQLSSLNDGTALKNSKLIYQGKLEKRIIYLKGLSLFSSVALAGSYGYVCNQHGISGAIAGMGLAFSPFILSPFIIAWFFKRYVISLYYDNQNDTYTIQHFGLLMNIKSLKFRKEEVIKSHAADALNTFKVGHRPFFLHDEDLIDVEAVDLYRRMIRLDESETSN